MRLLWLTMPEPRRRTRVGTLRPSQLIHTFGVGSVVDLPRLSAILLGLDEWPLQHARVIEEPRLLARIREVEGLERVERLYGPPQSADRGGRPGMVDERDLIGVPVAPFPGWLRCRSCQTLAPVTSGLFELRRDAVRVENNRYVHANCQKARNAPPSLPARFVVACEDGHLDDFPWVEFVHRSPAEGVTPCTAPRLELVEIGASGEVASIQVACVTCNAKQRMSQAFGEANRDKMPLCTGNHPHLRERTQCLLRMRPMLLGATNSWFPVRESSLSIPQHADELRQRIERKWDLVKDVAQLSDLEFLRRRGELNDFADVGDGDLLAAVEAHRSGDDAAADASDLRRPEWNLLTGNLRLRSADFRARLGGTPGHFAEQIARVVLVERLREVQALLGFTRVDSPYEETASDRRVPLARGQATFLPAAEVRGEGVFVQLNEARVTAWCSANAEREEAFLTAHSAWRARRKIPDPGAGFPGLRYVLVHTLAHALMRRLELDSGYSRSAIRERLYVASPEAGVEGMAGLLLYTAAPDSEGTLGGLVACGESQQLDRHLRALLADAGLCASDPLCAEHAPDDQGMTLHGAACHACLFAPETSCENGNRYLDREVLTRLITDAAIGFFP